MQKLCVHGWPRPGQAAAGVQCARAIDAVAPGRNVRVFNHITLAFGVHANFDERRGDQRLDLLARKSAITRSLSAAARARAAARLEVITPLDIFKFLVTA